MRWTCHSFAVLLGAAVGAAARTGYLPTVGPTPLRFQAMPGTFAKVALPPLFPAEATNQLAALNPPAANAVTPPATKPEAPPDTPPAIMAMTRPPETMTDSTAAPARDEQLVSPQMFLKFFHQQGTNAAGVSVLTPMGFVPPQPVAAPPSKASHEVKP